MKARIVGLGAVGRAAILAACQRGSALDLALVDRIPKASEAGRLKANDPPLPAAPKVQACIAFRLQRFGQPPY